MAIFILFMILDGLKVIMPYQYYYYINIIKTTLNNSCVHCKQVFTYYHITERGTEH